MRKPKDWIRRYLHVNLTQRNLFHQKLINAFGFRTYCDNALWQWDSYKEMPDEMLIHLVSSLFLKIQQSGVNDELFRYIDDNKGCIFPVWTDLYSELYERTEWWGYE